MPLWMQLLGAAASLCIILSSVIAPARSRARRWLSSAGLVGWCAVAVAIYACASFRPQIQEARDDVVLACRKLTAAMVGDLSPSKAERITQKVCLAETFAEQITREVEADGDALFSETLPLELPPATDAGAR